MTKDCIKRNYKIAKDWKRIEYYKERIRILKEFINGKPSIDLGGGGFIPKVLNVTHACDNNKEAGKLLKESGFKGKFKVVDIQKRLPYTNKQFKYAVCSEVIEHFRREEYITQFFSELNRISEKWLVTTPSKIFLDKDHYFFFFPNDLFRLIQLDKSQFIIYRKHPYYYITNDFERVKHIIDNPKSL